jgi:hypothetical protein
MIFLARFACAFLVGGFLSGCFLIGPGRGISKPPGDPMGDREWFETMVANADPAFLRCWHQASEYHRQRGSTATYRYERAVGMTMAGMYYHDQYYPTPIPAEFVPIVEARLATDASESPQADLVSVVRCKNCTEEEAWQAWKRHYK